MADSTFPVGMSLVFLIDFYYYAGHSYWSLLRYDTNTITFIVEAQNEFLEL